VNGVLWIAGHCEGEWAIYQDYCAVQLTEKDYGHGDEVMGSGF